LAALQPYLNSFRPLTAAMPAASLKWQQKGLQFGQQKAARLRYIVTPLSRFTGSARFNVFRNVLGTA
jgi:hypothetical protein